MTVIVDTNVLVSAVITDRLPQRVIEEIASSDDWFWLVTSQIAQEYREVLRRPKFKLTEQIYQQWIALLDAAAIPFETSARPPSFLADPKDVPFLTAALTSEADFLITGDKHFAEAEKLVASRIVTVAEFARLFAIA